MKTFIFHVWAILYRTSDTIPEVFNIISLRATKLKSRGCRNHDLKRIEKKQLNSQGNNHNLLMRYLVLFAVTKRCNIRFKQNGWQSTSDKWWFDSCKHSKLSTCSIWVNNCWKRYVVPNMLTTCWMWQIRLRNHLDRSIWFLYKSRMWQARNLDFWAFKRSLGFICNCNDISSQSTSKGKKKILKLGWGATI